MRTLSDTIARLAARRPLTPANPPRATPVRTHLVPLTRFGSNPGNLKGWCHVPPGLQPGAPLVVVLHGCTQTAAGYDLGSGWSTLAERHGFALLYPEQQRANNANLCFNWFVPEDIRRDGGEAMSIRRMIAYLSSEHALDIDRVYVTGLSAGGAMTSVMLAAYPELFAGGAVIAGLPFGSATGIPEAFDRMRGHGLPKAEQLAAKVRDASGHSGPWPLLSVWHGSADMTVSPLNGQAVVDQWRALQGLPSDPARTEQISGHVRRTWVDAAGRPRIEAYAIEGMGHGTPIDPDRCGAALPYMIDAGISSSERIAGFWGIAGATATALKSSVVETLGATRSDVIAPRAGSRSRAPTPVAPPALTGAARVIDDALRAAGLLR